MKRLGILFSIMSLGALTLLLAKNKKKKKKKKMAYYKAKPAPSPVK